MSVPLPCSQARIQTQQLNNGPSIPPYPWLRRSSDCGNTADINVAIIDQQSNVDVTDGMTVYADPFTAAPDGTRVAYYGGSGNRALLRIAPENLAGAVDPHVTDLGQMGAGWRAPFTTTQGYLLGAKGGLFIASCDGTTARLYYSYDDAVAPLTPSFKHIDLGTCGTALVGTTMGIARVAPVSSAWDIVRVAFTSPNVGSVAPSSCNCGSGSVPPCTCATYSVTVVDVKIPRPKTVGAPYFDAPTQYAAFPAGALGGTSYPAGSALNLNFIQPDGFEYFKAHSGGKVLPDTSVLTWTEGGSANTGATVGMPGTASYVVASGPPVLTAQGGVDPGLGGVLPLSVGCTGPCVPDQAPGRVFYRNMDSLLTIGPVSPSSSTIVPTRLGDMGDFEDGAFSYDISTDRFHFVTPWSQTDATQAAQVHYNVVEIQPPPPRVRYYIDASFTTTDGQVYLAKVRVPSVSRIEFAGKSAAGTWSQLPGYQCVDDDDTVTPDGDGPVGANAFTRTCLLRAPGIVKLAVLTRDVLVPYNVALPSFGVNGIREFFSTMDECGLPTVGAATHCFDDGTPPACAPLRSTCSTNGDCCSRLTCQSGTCAPAPVCSPARGACRTNTDCCAALLCTSGSCG